MNLNDLNREFGSDAVTFRPGPGGLGCVVVDTPLAFAEIALHGAHIMQYVPKGARPVLWMSDAGWFEADKPIRGGVPVCWPWFGPSADPALPAHGFARLSEWQVANVEENGGTVAVELRLTPQEVTYMTPPFAFELTMEFRIGSTLEMKLSMTNCSTAPQEITAALHTYLNVKAVEEIAVTGLDGVAYEDRVPGAAVVDCRQQGDIRIDREVDRIYLDHTGAVVVCDPGFGRTIRVEKSGSASTVVWNPWINKSRALPDFGDDEYHTMLCIEATNAAADRRTLAPGETHVLAQKLSVRQG